MVTAAQGVSMPTWVEGSHPGMAVVGKLANIPYQVVRQGLTVITGSSRQAASVILSENWSILLFTIISN
jgi:hypothetical protein